MTVYVLLVHSLDSGEEYFYDVFDSYEKAQDKAIQIGYMQDQFRVVERSVK